jgi:leucyl-tRNA synthetase
VERAQTGGNGGAPEADRKILRKLHQTIRKITEDFESRWHFNTSISGIMELVNDLYAEEARLSGATVAEVLEKLTLLLGPFAPYLAQEISEELGREGVVFRETWPAYDPELAKEDLAEIVVQVNGKLRSHIHAPFGTPGDVLKARALEDSKVRAFIEGKQIVKVIVVPDKLVNIVVAGGRSGAA